MEATASTSLTPPIEATASTTYDYYVDTLGVLFTDIEWKPLPSVPLYADKNINREKRILKERRFDTRHWTGKSMRKYKVG